jgi:hypothetical protein
MPTQQRKQRVPGSSAIRITIGLVFGWFSAANISPPVHCLTDFTILQACIYSHTFSVVSGAGNHPPSLPRLKIISEVTSRTRILLSVDRKRSRSKKLATNFNILPRAAWSVGTLCTPLPGLFISKVKQLHVRNMFPFGCFPGV